ncbi:ABSCISIC ACID-INSENSITIVE 5-like protein 7 [Andrographis paniculata]|uniref:ABSCISIC ACID-INSENSITIVE 5-like protein 7 n=1 Tax=Andrographis paniculata TaxID=175694 RepID=UPI0021E9796B|nr:ABSCISIC ACID-INSENSITIVE 5-like protein 7 [Andrographis paniculata]XP_051145034.1 ABSCISIC ACID-INSENSITIVE 5-like protein 7 [Andrographis paniculata]
MGSFFQDGNGGKPADNYLLSRQSSIFSLTFDEFQSTLGGPGREFGSMNMEELLKSIWTAEESQAVASSSSGVGDTTNLQRQSSLTIPRTFSQKTVDEVWRDVLKETIGAKDPESGIDGANLLPREPTLGEVTLEEFLFRAGVREDIQPPGRANATGIYNGSTPVNSNNTGLAAGFQQPSLLGNKLSQHNTMILGMQNIGTNLNGVDLSGIQSAQQPQSQLQPLFPKQTTIAFSAPTQLGNNGQRCSPERKSPVKLSPMNNNALGRAAVSRVSPGSHLHSDAIVSKRDPESISPPSSCVFSEGVRGRRSSNSLEKVVERRRRRMIKNRESAARSRARKQAYTLELEAEIEKLKAVNQELQKKQDEFVEMQKNQSLETKNLPSRGKRVCLRRTLTGPW